MCTVIKFPTPKGGVGKPPIAFRIGALAHEAGFAFLSNPYAPNTERHTEWADGWCSHLMGGDDG